MESSFGLAYPKAEGAPISPEELAGWLFDPKFTPEEIEEFRKRQLEAYNKYWRIKLPQ